MSYDAPFSDFNQVYGTETGRTGLGEPSPGTAGGGMGPPIPTGLPDVQVTGQRDGYATDEYYPGDTGGFNTSIGGPQGKGGLGIFSGLGDIFGGNMSPQMLNLLAGAGNDYYNSTQYMDLAGKYADRMDPFGKERPGYQDKLRQLESDPNGYLASSPDYQAALQQGLGAVGRSAASKGYAGSGTGSADEQRFGSQLAAQYLDRDRQSLMTMAGAQIGPGAAANLITHGIDASVAARNNAMTNLFRALNPTNGSSSGGGGGGDDGGILNLAKALTGSNYANPQMALAALKAAGYTNEQISQMTGGTGGGMGVGGGPDKNVRPYTGQQPGQGGGSPGSDGDTVTDPETGDVYIRQDGQWVPYDSPYNGADYGTGGYVGGDDMNDYNSGYYD